MFQKYGLYERDNDDESESLRKRNTVSVAI